MESIGVPIHTFQADGHPSWSFEIILRTIPLQSEGPWLIGNPVLHYTGLRTGHIPSSVGQMGCITVHVDVQPNPMLPQQVWHASIPDEGDRFFIMLRPAFGVPVLA